MADSHAYVVSLIFSIFIYLIYMYLSNIHINYYLFILYIYITLNLYLTRLDNILDTQLALWVDPIKLFLS